MKHYWSERSSPFISQASRRIITILLALCALMFMYGAYRSLFYLGDVAIPEGAVVYSVRGLLTGDWPLYRDYTVPPYSTTPYTPLFYIVSALVVWGTTKSVYAIYICCRLVTVFATVCAAFLVQRIVLLLKAEMYPLRYVAFLLPFSILTLIPWGLAARPDMLAILMSLAGIYMYLRKPHVSAGICCGAAILALAWWCKPSFIAAPAALFVTLLWERQWRRCGLFTAAYAVTIAVLAGVTQVLSQGWFFANVITANVTKLMVDQLYWLTIDGYLYLAPFVTAMALLGCAVYCRAIIREPKLRCVVLYLGASALLNMAACMKDGAYFNYMLEPLFIACILAPLAVGWLLKYKYAAILLPVLLLASLLCSFDWYWYCDGALENALSADINRENKEIQAIIDKMDGLKGDVLTSRSALAVRSAKPVLATDLFNARYLEEQGKISTHILAERIGRQELAAIVAPEGCQPSASGMPSCHYWPPSVEKAILEKYEPSETLNHHVFWYPKHP